MFSTSVSRPVQLLTRVLQWSSAVIVMGITSYFIHVGPRGQHLIYQEVIVCLCPSFAPSCLYTDELGLPVGRLLPPRLHLPIHADLPEQIRPRHRRHLLIPVCLPFPTWSHPIAANRTSWLTAFIFAAQDYNEQNCYLNAPPFMDCNKKKANEAFIFLALYVAP